MQLQRLLHSSLKKIKTEFKAIQIDINSTQNLHAPSHGVEAFRLALAKLPKSSFTQKNKQTLIPL